MKPIQCKNCKHFVRDIFYKSEGICNNDGRYTREHCVCNLLDTQENNKKEQATDIYNVLAAMPTDGEIMNAIHREKPIEPQNGFENAMMKKEYVAGFLTAVKWMQERHCR